MAPRKKNTGKPALKQVKAKSKTTGRKPVSQTGKLALKQLRAKKTGRKPVSQTGKLALKQLRAKKTGRKPVSQDDREAMGNVRAEENSNHSSTIWLRKEICQPKCCYRQF